MICSINHNGLNKKRNDMKKQILEINEKLRIGAIDSKEAQKQLCVLFDVGCSLPSKEEFKLELDEQILKNKECHSKKVNSAYAIGFRHCYWFISDKVGGIRDKANEYLINNTHPHDVVKNNVSNSLRNLDGKTITVKFKVTKFKPNIILEIYDK